jgi:two-component system nitrogen regulation sensor histidine kinase NtrY
MAGGDANDVPERTAGEGRAPYLDPTDRAFWVGFSLVVASIVVSLVSYLTLTGLTPLKPSNVVVWVALGVNVALMIAVIAVITSQIRGLWRAWRDKVAGARLHIRIVALFSVIAALPALLLAVAATTTFSRSLDSSYDRVRGIIDSSLNVARAYVDEHGLVIRTDVLNMARDIDDAAGDTASDDKAMQRLLISQAGLRDLSGAWIIDAAGRLVVAGGDDPRMPFTTPPERAIKLADSGQVAVLTSNGAFRVSALVKLDRYPGRYLYVSRAMSPAVVGHLLAAQQNLGEYERLRRVRVGLKVAHGLIYSMITMTALLSAIWIGLWFAGRFVAPIRRLIAAAQDVSRGNLAVALPEKRGEGDLRRLSKTFNTMTRELKHQRDALVTANEQLSERRRFIEAVLSGVSAGVIGVDSGGRITLVSRSAERLLGIVETEVKGRRVGEVVPPFGSVLDRHAEPSLRPRAPDEVALDISGEARTFSVRVTHEKGPQAEGAVMTFDDITELVSAQRTSAWADVARRIAHEIKNPLTPIMLSAERIRRKYGKVITEDRETFEKLTATIERQAGDIKTMVDEFASFARVPKPVIEKGDLREAVQEPVILFREGHPDVTYELKVPPAPVLADFDRRLVSQAVTNLVKNATEAVESSSEGRGGAKGRVEVVLRPAEDRLEIEVIDNGMGLPKQNRARLLEPYVTTKGHKGTGLGLAIVQKITEQHGGALTLEDAPTAPDRPTGALIRITLPARRQAAGGANDDAPPPAAAAAAS